MDKVFEEELIRNWFKIKPLLCTRVKTMSDETRSNNPLRKVDEKYAREMLLEGAALHPFNAGNFEQVLNEREFLLAKGLEVQGATGTLEAVRSTLEQIPAILKQEGAIVEPDQISTDELLKRGRLIGLNLS